MKAGSVFIKLLKAEIMFSSLTCVNVNSIYS